MKPKDNPNLVKDPSLIGLQVKEVIVTTEDEIKLKGWLVSSDRSKRIIVYFHGNMVRNFILMIEMWWRLLMIKHLKENNDSDILIISYRGYSENEGKPSEQGLKKDAAAIMDYAITHR